MDWWIIFWGLFLVSLVCLFGFAVGYSKRRMPVILVAFSERPIQGYECFRLAGGSYLCLPERLMAVAKIADMRGAPREPHASKPDDSRQNPEG